MQFDIITIFPEMIESYTNESILKRAQEKKLIKIKAHNLRDFTTDKHHKVDDRPFGGGPGMVLKIEPIAKAIGSILRSKVKGQRLRVILFEPGGKQFDEKMAQKLAKEERLVMVCGRYEGIDDRVKKVLRDSGFTIQIVSVGPYVLTGGELPAMILMDAISRKISGVLGKEESLEENRLGVGVPMYTRPAEFKYNPDALSRGSDRKRRRSYKVPKVLIGGNHVKIDEWREKNRK